MSPWRQREDKGSLRPAAKDEVQGACLRPEDSDMQSRELSKKSQVQARLDPAMKGGLWPVQGTQMEGSLGHADSETGAQLQRGWLG